MAILLVIVGHTLTFNLHFLEYLGLEMAALGVLLFFILSGYLITGLIAREINETGTIDLPAFYLRRAFRLLPALLVFLSAVIALRSSGALKDVQFKDIAAALLYVRNIFGSSQSLGHLWSLSLEEQFYTIWPVLFVSVRATPSIVRPGKHDEVRE